MLNNLPSYVSIIFGLTTLTTLLLFYWVLRNSSSDKIKARANFILVILTIWLIIQAVITLRNIYNTNLNSMPPKIFLFGVLPAIISIIILFATTGGRRFIDSLPLVNITYLNIIRVPVEMVLLWLFLYKAVPQLITFEGSNFDLFSGLTAPVIAYSFSKGRLGSSILLMWNILCLVLLLNVVISALLSVPAPLQQFAFDQPNIAVLNFPFSWLPTFIVPIVLFGHLVSIRKLISGKTR